ncbi:MAG: hypothetical protein JSS72_11625 [Armatimonadetes bacterium]|nr:hypothetical protein [Armatimonadota bacterium]
MLAGPAFYQDAFEHEITANHAMLKMLASVPEANRADARFQRAVNLASHMVICREGFLNAFLNPGAELPNPFEDNADFATLESRFAKMEADWQAYLSGLQNIEGMFTFSDNGERWKINLEAQIFQLVGHAAYHRGQVVLLVDQLGGETTDTDYIEWFTATHPGGWAAAD